MTRGVQGTTVGGKSFSVVSVTGSDRYVVCFGIVGKSEGSFCIKQNCGVASQSDTKISFQGREETCYFICRGGEGSSIIYSQPSIDERQVPAAIKEGWTSQQKTLAEWRTAFNAVKYAGDEGATIEEIKKEVSFLNDASNYRSPSKPQGGYDERRRE